MSTENIKPTSSHCPNCQHSLLGAKSTSPSSPSTPLRNIHSAFGSPSTLRAEEEVVIVEFGTRSLRVGFVGDPVPRGFVTFGPEQSRRVGDFRAWQADYQHDWRKRATGKDWGRNYELWKFDVRGLDLGLVGDRVERGLREAFTKYLLIDSKPRRMVAVLPSSMPLPLLSCLLDTLFSRFQPPTVSLLSAPTTTTVAAGVRSALVVDLGWSETVVTAVYDYREIGSNRTIRGGRMLVEQMHKLLKRCITEEGGKRHDEGGNSDEYVVSFDECDDLTSRLTWCRPAKGSHTSQQKPDALPTVQEQDETDMPGSYPEDESKGSEVPLASTSPPITIHPTFDQLSEPCESTFFDLQRPQSEFDDEELPVHVLVYRSLLQLPMDVRAVCMSRIIFTGGCSNVLGLRGRIFDEVSQLVHERGWSGVTGKAVEQLQQNPKLKRRGSRQASEGPSGVGPQTGGGEEDEVWHDAANAAQEKDPIEEQLRKAGRITPGTQGGLRCVESLGPWSGGSLVTQLKVPAIATIDRELWLQQGAAGASRPNEVDIKTQQRQSMGAGGLMRNASAGSNWTLGVWGAI
ncbi:actin-like ATPase domain-containing protein [Coniochaeta ligniaria NRRL 30616]|uniref:Actin-like ATPase domain-containing protein n=1 Tax=Coniochaeta ligniaria NRRL 30616 TaxID=1408157 RepID=A0A1J7JFF8_9PEZI|nr:actin-like ATPase domain-containing protein [Coniochaeta ligniaria NRRL 30616]